MPESQSQGNGGNQGGGSDGNTQPGTEFTPITSQEEFDARLKDRLARERAKFSDYETLKHKAEKHDEAEEANKSELTKAQDEKAKADDETAKAKAERDEAKADALRLRVAIKHNVSDEDADLFLTGTDEATLTKQAERLSQRQDSQRKGGNYVPREGNPTTQTGDNDGGDLRSFTRGLFGSDEG